VLPLFASYLGADPAGVGMVAAVSAFTGIFVGIPAGMLSDRVGRRRMLIFAALVFSTAPFLYLLVTQLWQLALIRLYHGVATAVFIPVAMALVVDLFHKERGEKIGWFSASTLIGRFMAPIVGGAVIGMLALNPGIGYRVVYLVCGIAGVLALLLVFSIPDQAKAKGDEQRWAEKLSSLMFIALTNKGILITSIVEAAMLFAYGTFETFLPLYSIKIGLSAYTVGAFLSAQVITLALTKPMMGRFSDRHGRKPQIIVGAIIGALCVGSISLFESFLPLLALSILLGLSLSIVTSATSALIADLSRRETHGSAMGVFGSIMDIGHTAGPLASGIVVTYFGFGKAFVMASLILIAAAFLFWLGAVAGGLVGRIEEVHDETISPFK